MRFRLTKLFAFPLNHDEIIYVCEKKIFSLIEPEISGRDFKWKLFKFLKFFFVNSREMIFGCTKVNIAKISMSKPDTFQIF